MSEQIPLAAADAPIGPRPNTHDDQSLLEPYRGMATWRAMRRPIPGSQ